MGEFPHTAVIFHRLLPATRVACETCRKDIIPLDTSGLGFCRASRCSCAKSYYTLVCNILTAVLDIGRSVPFDSSKNTEALSSWVLIVPEAGRLLGIGRNSAYYAARKGEISTLKIGRRLVVPKSALYHLLGNPPDFEHSAEG